MRIGDRIRELRRKERLTQSQLAQKIGVSTGAIGLWEVNKREPDANMLLKLSKVFDVPVDYILENEERNTLIIIDESGYCCRFQLSEEKLQVIAKLAELLEY